MARMYHKKYNAFKQINPLGKGCNLSNLIGELINEQLPLQEERLLSATYRATR